MSVRSLLRRWLLTSGVPAEEVDSRVRAVQARIVSYPAPVRWLHGPAAWLIEIGGAFAALGKPQLASRLSDDDFERLLDRLARHRRPKVRTLFQLVVLPLMEKLVAEDSPSPIPHPLARTASPALGLPATDRSSHGVSGRSLAGPAETREFDVVIIGSGAGGAPLAWSLAERGVRVAVVEAGAVVQPPTTAEALERYYLQQGLVASVSGGLVPVLMGTAVGGTTVINSGTCLRPPADRLAVWTEMTAIDFGATLGPYLDAVEKTLPVVIPDRSLLSTSDELMARGLERLGRQGSYVLPRNIANCTGSGRCSFVCPTGSKRSTDRSYLPLARDAGAAMFFGCQASGIRETSMGVETRVEGPSGTFVLAAKELVLAAGAAGTPALIRRNRLGDRWRQAGDHLKIHPAAKVFAHFPEPIGVDRGIPQGLGYHATDHPRLNFEGISTPKSVVARILPLVGRRQRWWLDEYEHVASYGVSLQERAVGWIRNVAGLSVVGYRLDLEDARDLGAGLLLIAESFFAAGADRVLLPAWDVPSEIASTADLGSIRREDFGRDGLLAGGFHPQGTAGIGRVVDGDLKLSGTRHIHVCDASVFPESPRVNPQWTIMALSLRLADRLVGRLLEAKSPTG